MKRIESKTIWLSISLGLVLGGMISIPPWEIGFFIGLVLLIHLGLCWPRPFVALLSAGLTVLVAAFLPVKHLDRTVGPMDYELMPLEDLTHALRNDWDIPVSPASSEARAFPVALNITEAMPRRKVLDTLARETGGDVRIGYCGTGASILFGGHPSFTYVSIAQPGDAGNGVNPRREER